MKKLYTICIIFLITFTMNSCAFTQKNPSLGDATIAKSIDKNTSRPKEISSHFVQSDPEIYFIVKTTNFPKDTKLKAVWKYLGDGTEVAAEIICSGTNYEVFTMKRSGNQFPSGNYEVTASATVNGKQLSAKADFEITAEVKPVHILNPVTSKSVDSQDKLNPVNITSEFKQSDNIIYFIIQSKDLPKNTKVTCIWYYKDTGDNLSHIITTEGTRNIAFTLKPDAGQKLLEGKYAVTASVTINNQTESVSKEFSVINE
ncbi:MAG: hypothetical protein QME45_03645 [Clostridiales bacterium]|nr:hypothetical protein [Clostridiales bacterium]HBM79663.1 hypothetical protein [Clostridiaceae bacterium]